MPAQQYARRGRPRKASPLAGTNAEGSAGEEPVADVREKKMRPETTGRQVVPTDQNIDGEEPQYAANATITCKKTRVTVE
jgi:hypothetical protein